MRSELINLILDLFKSLLYSVIALHHLSVSSTSPDVDLRVVTTTVVVIKSRFSLWVLSDYLDLILQVLNDQLFEGEKVQILDLLARVSGFASGWLL